jgi:pilus assembly protein CpaC
MKTISTHIARIPGAAALTGAMVILFLLLLGIMQGYGGYANAANAPYGADLVTVSAEQQHMDPTLVLTRGKAEIIDIDGPISDIMVADPTVVDVQVLQSNRLYMVGAQIGDTNLIAVDAAGNIISRMNVHVRIDELRLQQMISSMFPKENVNINSAGDQLVLSGKVSTPAAASAIQDLASRFTGEAGAEAIVNMMDIQGSQQVMLRVKIMEISRALTRELGIRTELPQTGSTDLDADQILSDIFGNNSPGSVFPAGALDSAIQQLHKNTQGSYLITGGGLTETPYGAFTIFNDSIAPLLSRIEALDRDNLVRTLAEPNLTTLSGQDAGFLAGGEQPVPSGRDSEGNVEITFQPFGVLLNFMPVVLTENRISLQLDTEVSSLSRENFVQISGFNIPGRDVRRASTNVELPSGGTMMIGGLIKSETLDGMETLPGAKNMPIIGDLMNSKTFLRNETELVIMITAYLAKPQSEAQDVVEVPEDEYEPLTVAFSKNIRRTYSKLQLPDLLNEEAGFGYILE